MPKVPRPHYQPPSAAATVAEPLYLILLRTRLSINILKLLVGGAGRGCLCLVSITIISVWAAWLVLDSVTDRMSAVRLAPSTSTPLHLLTPHLHPSTIYLHTQYYLNLTTSSIYLPTTYVLSTTASETDFAFGQDGIRNELNKPTPPRLSLCACASSYSFLC